MIGLAKLAAKLACLRVYGDSSTHHLEENGRLHPSPRRTAFANSLRANIEYYRIVDRITRGEKP